MNYKIPIGRDLACPTCWDNYTHCMGVEVINRYDEDNKKGTRVTIRGHHVSFSDDAQTDNPSERRNGVVLRFSCEHGCDDFLLRIAQHEGITIFDVVVLTGQGCEWRSQK